MENTKEFEALLKIIERVESETNDFLEDLYFIKKTKNKSIGRRARKKSTLLNKTFKEFRKVCYDHYIENWEFLKNKQKENENESDPK
ncbi:MAG: hypothetical protein ACQEP8_00780 [Chlamydiota bacterium]